MKFAHMADCHIGGWREPKLREASSRAFEKAVQACIDEEVDFVLIAGDLFDTALPSIDSLKSTVVQLKKLKEKDIPVYTIAGSHDFSASGKTILDVLEEAGMIINVVKGSVDNNRLKLNFTLDKKTGVKITGMIGKKRMLEKRYYETLDNAHLEKEPGYKIFMFHSAISEIKPKELEKIESMELSYLPKNFEYYAGGHVHIVKESRIDGYKNIVFPGPLFPANFREIEELAIGGFYIVEDSKARYHPVKVYNTNSITIDCSHKDIKWVEEEIDRQIKNKEFINTIVTLRLIGTLASGKPSEINFKDVFKKFYDKSAYFVMKSTTRLNAPEFNEIKVKENNVEDVEASLIKEHLGQIKVYGMDIKEEEELTRKLMELLSIEKEEGETNSDFEKRLRENTSRILGL